MQNREENIKQRVALYIRVSTDEQVEKFGIDLQKAALEGVVKSKPDSMVLAGEKYVYIDEGVSGTVDTDERPAFSRLKEDLMMAPVEDRPFDVVAVYKIDRFARQLRILLEVIDFFDQYDIKFVSANESIDTSTPFGKAMLGIIGVIAELERDTILKRTRDGRLQAFEQGIVLGNTAPYGYTKDEYKKYKVLEEEAKNIREIFRLFIDESRSVDYIARHLREHQVLSPAASAIHHKKRKGEVRKKNELYFWSPGAVRRILEDEIYIGRIYGNKFVGGKLIDKSERKLSGASAPLVIDFLTFEKAQRLLRQNKHQRQVAKDGHIYLLSGLLKCDCCYDPEKDGFEGRMGLHGDRRKKDGKMLYYYRCGRKNQSKTTTVCNSLPLSAVEIEEYLVNYIKNLLKNPQAAFAHQKKLRSGMRTIEHLRSKESGLLDLIQAIPHRKNRLREQHAAGLLGIVVLKKELSDLDSTNERLQKERGEVQAQIAAHALSQGYLDALGVFSDRYYAALKAGLQDRATLYTLLHSLVEEVVVYTRPITEEDVVAGRRKEDQEIPYRLHIKLKLPQDILAEIADQHVHLSEDAPEVRKGSSGRKSISSAR